MRNDRFFFRKYLAFYLTLTDSLAHAAIVIARGRNERNAVGIIKESRGKKGPCNGGAKDGREAQGASRTERTGVRGFSVTNERPENVNQTILCTGAFRAAPPDSVRRADIEQLRRWPRPGII